MEKLTTLDQKIKEMAARIRELRELEGKTVAEMAAFTDISEQEYIACESGEQDLNFAFIYRVSQALNVNVTEIIEGISPNLKSYTVTRRGAGQKVSQAHGMTYYNLAYAFQNRIAEPLYVKSKYNPEAQTKPMELTTHDGQEIDIVIEGQLMVQVGDHKEILGPGDTIYFDSNTPHGEMAVGEQDCIFYAIVLNPKGEPIPELTSTRAIASKKVENTDTKERVWKKFVDYEVNENGTPTKVTFKNTDHFNFGYDVIDAISYKDPDKLAMIHVGNDKTEHRFTFTDIRHASCQCANYFKSLGIRKGDRVMLILKRHYQFWFAIIGLHKLGAIAIPATNQLQAHDLEYRFKAAGVSAIVCTGDGYSAEEVEKAMENYPQLKRIMVNGVREGWRNFDEEYRLFSSHFERKESTPCGDDIMLMYFTSGTSGYPKIAAHSYKLALGHFMTAHFWHNVDPDGLHFTISDTGWAKAAWGKLYGQWFCEAPMFVYDFDRFHADDILPMFAKYHITTFCAPPTMLRMMIKEDISKYDFSSVKRMTTAGEALNPEVYNQFEKLTGLQIMEGFGQTETAVIICNMIGAPHKIGSMGKPSPIYDIHLIDKDGNDVPDGEPGEIVINIADGMPCGLALYYYNDVDSTRKNWRNGYYHTGDLAWRDEDGFFWYVGRADDVIKSSGYRIGPFEIESVIMELPYVLECGVSAAPDPVRGQVVKASIVLVKGTEGTDELKKEIQEYVKTHTAPYKYPRIVVFRESLPKTTSGKIQRNLL
ncbi:AMP-binding protein [Ruminococcus sp.]|uniref:AMP-binding protein n=1 Tax=Ruminococcus sp. TaxID=41978 RepID=UPI00388EE923